MQQNKLAKSAFGTSVTGWQWLIGILLIVGIFFRFAYLDQKVYWYDETYTSLRVSGFTEAEMVPKVFNGQVMTIADLHQYQRPSPLKTEIDTMQSLAAEEPQHPPVYYVMARLWTRGLGSTIATLRSLSAFNSLLVFPCIYWLCWELFKSPLTGWLAVGLTAVSPFHLAYAQEARQYSLWMALILLSSTLLLRAYRKQTGWGWVLYAGSIVLNLYTYSFSALVVLAHGVYIAVMERFRLNHTTRSFLLAATSSIVAFIPWILAISANLTQVNTTTEWTGSRISLPLLGVRWLGNLSRVFVDINLSSGVEFGLTNPVTYAAILFSLSVTFLVGYSLYFLYRKASRSTGLFILLLIGVPLLSLVVPDLVLGGLRSGVARYSIPCYLGVQVAVAYLLTMQLTSNYSNLNYPTFWRLVSGLVVSAGFFSCVLFSQTPVWWSKGTAVSRHYPVMANLINQATEPIVVSNSPFGRIMPLTYLLDSDVRLQLVLGSQAPQIPQDVDEVFVYSFLFDPSDEQEEPVKRLRQNLEQTQGFKATLAHEDEDTQLWQLKRS